MFVKWIPIDKIEPLISYEAFLVCFAMMLIAYAFYYLFLKGISLRRHGQLRERFIMTTLFVTLSGLMASLYWILHWQNPRDAVMNKLLSYLALITLIIGSIAIIRISQIYVYLYLFFSNMTTGVPRLIVNLFTFLFSIFLFALIGHSVFGLNVATVTMTSAAFSIVLGLALQDTLGNFFSGLALQIDSPFHISDWVEIQDGDQKWVGQIHEINWRATYMMSFADELIMFPNKTIANSKIKILSSNIRPLRINHEFRFTYDTPIEVAKIALLEGVMGYPGIMTSPGPSTLITEVTDSWLTIKVYYSVEDYGNKFSIGDAVITKIMDSIRKHQLKLANPTITVNK